MVVGLVHNCATGIDGTLWCWGDSRYGQLGDGTTTNRTTPVQVAALGTQAAQVVAREDNGLFHTCARRTDGSVWCWGSGLLGHGTATQSAAPLQVDSLETHVAELATGIEDTYARKADGSLWCWGHNSFGELGDGTTTLRMTPVRVVSLGTQVAHVVANDFSACALKIDGTLWCWGDNKYGQLGDGTTTMRTTPVQVAGLGADIAQVAVGFEHTCALKMDGTLWCWGGNSFGELGDGTNTNRNSPVQVRCR